MSLVNINPDDSGPVLITGSSGLFTLAMGWQIDFYENNIPILNIDCAIRFNVFPLVNEAMRRGHSPEDVLSSIYIQRAFNPYQILDSLNRILNMGDKLPWLPVLLAPAKQFFDGDVGKDEGAYMLGRMLKVLSDLKKEGIPFIVVEKESYPSAQYFPEFLKKLSGFMSVHHRISPYNMRKLISHTDKRGKHNGPNHPSLFHADFHDRRPAAQLSEISA